MTNFFSVIGGCGFTSRRIYPPEAENTYPSAVVVADINDDNKPDIVVANLGTHNVGIRLNVGNGTFTGQTMYSTGGGSSPRSVAIGDVNGDNKPDIIVANSATNNVGVLLNMGNLVFTTPMMYSTGSYSYPYCVQTVDVNGDNKPDIIVANSYTSNVGVLLNKGNGTFSRQTTYSTGDSSSPQSVTTADVNGDNKPDIIVANFYTGNVGVLLNTGNGTFSRQMTYSVGHLSFPNSVTTADVNGDNKPDIIVANSYTNNVGVLLNTGNGMFASQTTYSTGDSSSPYSVTTADVNGDSKLDILVANSDINTIGVLLNRGNGTFTNQTTYGTGSSSSPRCVVAADIDGDNKPDIIVANFYTHNVGVLLNTGNGTFTSPITHPTASNMAPRSVITADMNGDNKFDIVVANSGWDNIGVYLSTVNSLFVSRITYPTGYGSSPRSLVAVDLNGDSTLDIIVANHGTDNVGVLLNVGGDLLFTSQTIYSTGLHSGPQSVLMVDVNNDSKLDIIVANEGSGSVGVFLNIGNGSFTSQAIYSTAYGSHSYSVATADVNSDNKPDIVVANYGTNNVGVLLNMGNGIFSVQTTYSTGPNSQPCSVITVDVNGDSKLDIIVTNSNGNNVGVFFNMGNGTLSNQTIYSTGSGSGSRSLSTADMNGDSKPDIIVGNSGTDNLCVFLNLGDGTFAIQTTYPTGYGSSPQSVTTADVDLDGKPDIIVANYGTNIVDILVNLGNGMFTSPMLYSTNGSSYPGSVATADINGDNKPDIIVANSYTDNVGVLLNTGNGIFTSQTTYSTAGQSRPISVTTADVDGDNKLDILVANSYTDNVGVLLNTGNGTFSRQTHYSTGLNSFPYSVTTADVNGDNKPDIIVANFFTNNVGVLLNTGNGTFFRQMTYSTGGNSFPHSVTTADVNGDNNPDIIVANTYTNNVGVLLNTGNGMFANQTTYSTGDGSSPQSVITADINGDSKYDIVVALGGLSAVGVLLSTGNGTFADLITYSTVRLSPICAVAVVDINGDNHVDIIYSSCRYTFGVLLNTGNGSFILLAEYITDGYTPPFYFEKNAATPASLTSADVNGDNKFDIIVANSEMSGVSVFLHC